MNMAARKKEYPEIRTLAARLEAIQNAQMFARNVLEFIQRHLVEHLPEKFHPVKQEIQEALDKLHLSHRALCGLDDEE
jgi:BMFP domain-containing protein YqiC